MSAPIRTALAAARLATPRQLALDTQLEVEDRMRDWGCSRGASGLDLVPARAAGVHFTLGRVRLRKLSSLRTQFSVYMAKTVCLREMPGPHTRCT